MIFLRKVVSGVPGAALPAGSWYALLWLLLLLLFGSSH